MSNMVPTGNDKLRAEAAALVESEVNSLSSPLKARIGTLENREATALQGIGQTFQELQPTVDASVGAVRDSYSDAQGAQAQIFTEANKRLNDLRQGRAAEAQRLAQEIGGPVAIDEYTAGFDPAIKNLTELGAGQQLHTLGYAQAGVQQAAAFSGRVFPLLRTEAEAQARRQYESQIEEIEGQLEQLNAQKPQQVNARYVELQKTQLSYQLDQARLKLDQKNSERNFKIELTKNKAEAVKARRDWQATLATIDAERKRIQLAEKTYDLQAAGVTGYLGNKPTLASRELTARIQQMTSEEKRQAAALGLSQAEYALKLKELDLSTEFKRREFEAEERVFASELLDATLNPSVGKTVKRSQLVDAAPPDFLGKAASGSFADKGSSTGYSKIITIYEQPPSEAITDPDKLTDYLVANGVPKSKAVGMVKARLGLKNWVYGKKAKK